MDAGAISYKRIRLIPPPPQGFISHRESKSQIRLSVISTPWRNTGYMTARDVNSVRRYVRGKRLGAVLGAAALSTLGVLSFSASPPDTTAVDIPLAGSGSAPVNTSFVQPVVSAMTRGNTITVTTPASAPEVSMAVPPIKAGH
jgi:hypothetical protein